MDTKRRYKIYAVQLDTFVAMMNWRQSLGMVALPDVPELPAGYEVGAANYSFDHDAILIRVHHESFPEVNTGQTADRVVPLISPKCVCVPVPHDAGTVQSMIRDAVAKEREACAAAAAQTDFEDCGMNYGRCTGAAAAIRARGEHLNQEPLPA